MLHLDKGALFEIIPIDESATLSEAETTQPSLDFLADIPMAVRAILDHHAFFFSVPSGLPPARWFDHRIHLLPNTKTVNVRPYRYPYF